MLRDDDFVINDENWRERCLVREVNGEKVGSEIGYGLVPRNYGAVPVGSMEGSVTFEAVTDMPLIPMEEWPERIAEKVAKKSQLSDIWRTANNGGPIPSLDQNGRGYCWSHSAVTAAITLRAVANMPYVRLSAYAVACIIKNYRDEGGWGAQALDWIIKHGVPSVEFWPEKSVNRNNDNEAMRANASLHKISEGWIDLQAAQYDRTLSAQQVGTCLLSNVPGIFDYNFWRHSVGGHDLVDVYPNRSARDLRRYGVRIKNSWTDSYGTQGWGVLTDSKAWPDGATAPRSIMLSNA